MKTLYITGKLAYDGLQNILLAIYPEQQDKYKIKEIGVNVAALMTTVIIKNRLSKEELIDIDTIMLPGRCRANLEELTRHFGIPVILGPQELRDLPEFLNKPSITIDPSEHDITLIAEIYYAPLKTIDEILAIADSFVADGADVIDIGCLPETKFPQLEEIVSLLVERGYTVSIDSLDPDELIRGANSGAKFLLSLSESTIWVAKEVNVPAVIIPETPNDMESLKRAIHFMEDNGKKYIADSVLYPINCGMVNSLNHYYQLRQEFPNSDFLMGIGNVTELVDADTLGINVLLLAIASELKVNYLLTSQLNQHCHTVVKELYAARQMLYASKKYATIPQGFGNELMALHDKDPFMYSFAEVMELYNKIKDPSYRINITKEGIHVFNRDKILTMDDPFELIKSIDLHGDVSHAFYLGYEMAKAKIARELGKRYTQDQELEFGCITKKHD